MNDPSIAEHRRAIPSVDRVLRDIGPTDIPRPLLLQIVREQLEQCRNQPPQVDGLLPAIHHAIARYRRSRLQPVVNATGIIIHTNFGRSPLAAEAVKAMQVAAENCTNLEFDLNTAKRGGRARSIEQGLALLTQAEAATVVNNCAAALVLAVRHFASVAPRGEVIISRGELVQIGGGFRIPDILESAGATLREVGTTNRTSVDDYARAIGPHTAMILKVHHSNFAMTGFVESASLAQLSPLARSAKIPLIDDLGSGSMQHSPITKEPTPADSIAAGADLVLFSGDKLLGGPQAGIIAGSSTMVEALKHDPMFRAVRCDKLILAALQATVDLHLNDQTDHLPIVQMMHQSLEQLRSRASRILTALEASGIAVALIDSVARIGGGAAPEATIPSVALQISNNRSADEFMNRLRHAPTPVIGYIESGHVHLDLRTVSPRQDQLIIEAIQIASAV